MMKHPKSIYEEERKPFINPFQFQIDPMKRLLLVNFEKDPDLKYIGLEPQYFDDEINGKGLLVIAWRKDMKVDVYHETSLQPNPDKFDIAGKGLGLMKKVIFEQKDFDINQYGVQANIIFRDSENRKVEILIEESHPKMRKPFGLLAPMGDAASNPSAMPLVLLHDFYFVRRNNTTIHVRINGKSHQVDKLPIPLDNTWMFFARYSSDPFIVTFNPAKSGKFVNDQEGLRLEENGYGKELKELIQSGDGHEIRLTFLPAFPQINLLKQGTVLEGAFEIAGHESTGKISGNYHVKKIGGKVLATLIPIGGWQPNESKLSLRFLYMVAKVFKNWPKSYIWNAELAETDNGWEINSNWQRLR
jgi:hypothetical protein